MNANQELAARAALKTLPDAQREAVFAVLEDLEDQLQPYVADESLGGDHKLQLAGKLAGVWLVQERIEQLATANPRREQELLAVLQQGN